MIDVDAQDIFPVVVDGDSSVPVAWPFLFSHSSAADPAPPARSVFFRKIAPSEELYRRTLQVARAEFQHQAAALAV